MTDLVLVATQSIGLSMYEDQEPAKAMHDTVASDYKNKIIPWETRWRIEEKDGATAILGLHPSPLRARIHKLRMRRPEAKEPD